MKRRSRVAVLAGVVGAGVGAWAAIVVAMLLLLGVVFGIAVSSISFGVPEREHLQPIPIDVASCPYVAGMHEAANQYQIARVTAILAVDNVDADLEPVTWSEARVHLDEAAAGLEQSITASVDQFPTEIQRQLTIARDSLTDGRSQLALASDYWDLAIRTSDLENDGQLAFGYADDLIGTQCPVPLRADTETMLPPFTTSTVPERTPPNQ